MSSLEFRDYEIMAADLGPENFMPDIGATENQEVYALTDRVCKEDAENIGQGMIHSILPYTLQDNYNRDRKPRKFHAAILENDKLRAVFLPELGGRLWSLYHKGLERELLYVNPVFQPANLALRNAWFSGGVEWNLGIRGHTPLTCSPMYACAMEDKNGTPVLRMYEYERVRGVAYSMDFLLPEGSDILYVRTTIENTASEEKFMYWWSNMAVPETPGTRVLVPASKSIKTYYQEDHFVVDCVDIPYPNGDGVDCTYPVNTFGSNDYFFRIPKEEAKWIAAVEGDGKGLLQFSTPELTGRKLFLWGQGRGGRNWNRWLAGEPLPYIEIQAGLARTQYEHIRMPGQSTITWVEGYTAAQCNPELVHDDFPTASKAVAAYLDTILPDYDAMRSQFDGLKMGETLQYGSAWGQVENRLRSHCGGAPISKRLEFPAAAIGAEEAHWLEFLDTGYLKPRDLSTPPRSFQADSRWIPLFAQQIAAGKANAYMYLQYGTVLCANDQFQQACHAYQMSNALEPNAWAWRNLAMLEKGVYKDLEKAADSMEQAVARSNADRGLMVNCAQILLEARRYDRWLAIFDTMPQNLQADGRLQLYQAIALLELERYADAARVITPEFVLSDIREGEVSLSHIWKRIYGGLLRQETGVTEETALDALLQENYPLPALLDFQMDQ